MRNVAGVGKQVSEALERHGRGGARLHKVLPPEQNSLHELQVLRQAQSDTLLGDGVELRGEGGEILGGVVVAQDGEGVDYVSWILTKYGTDFRHPNFLVVFPFVGGWFPMLQ